MTAIERGILFSAPMVRKILGNQKSQTRRVKKTEVCPYRVGDCLWVRETWGLHAYGDDGDWFRGSIRGMSEESLRAQYNLVMRADWGPMQEGCYWRPAIFMPRWASRIALEVTEVRVQRLHEISEDDASAEGVSCDLIPPDDGKFMLYPTARQSFAELWDSINGERRVRVPAPWPVLNQNVTEIDMSIAWDANPLVWAISFKKLQ